MICLGADTVFNDFITDPEISLKVHPEAFFLIKSILTFIR